jgi:hypothetical protein
MMVGWNRWTHKRLEPSEALEQMERLEPVADEET